MALAVTGLRAMTNQLPRFLRRENRSDPQSPPTHSSHPDLRSPLLLPKTQCIHFSDVWKANPLSHRPGKRFGQKDCPAGFSAFYAELRCWRRRLPTNSPTATSGDAIDAKMQAPLPCTQLLDSTYHFPVDTSCVEHVRRHAMQQ